MANLPVCAASRITMFPLSPASVDTVKNLASSITNILTAPERRLCKNRTCKQNSLNLVRYLIRSPRCKLPSELCGCDFVEAILLDILKKNKVLSCPGSTHQLLHVARAAVGASFDSTLKNNLINVIIKNLLFDMSQDVCNFLSHIWQTRDSIPLYSHTLEELAIGLPLCLENTLLDLAQKAVQAQDDANVNLILQAYNMQSFLYLCSKSVKTFQRTITILHQLLLISNINSKVLLLIRNFVSSIKEQCQKTSFVELFPVEQQALLMFLQVDPRLYPDDFVEKEFTRISVLNSVVEGLQQNRRATGALLTLYPDWFPFVQEFCMSNNITEFLPANLKCSNEMYQMYLLFC